MCSFSDHILILLPQILYMSYGCWSCSFAFILQMPSLHTKGIAFLCFTADDAQVYGRLVVSATSVFILRGKVCNSPSSHFHECCFESAPKFYELAVKDDSGMEFQQELIIKPLMRLGGDNCSLVCDNRLEFSTDQLLAGQKADEYIAKYLSPQLMGLDCYVCIGPMSIDVDYDNFTSV